MKIKAVCDATGLTDRAIRYYIDEELLSPAYTENYLGRKSFDFSQTDIQQLKDIAILRKFGFSIPELRQMLLHPETILPTARQLQLRMETSVSETQSHLAALSRLDHNRSYTLWELADFLSKPVSRTPLPPEDSIARPKILSYYLKKIIIFLVTWYPIVLTAIVILHYIRWYQYPVFNGMTVLLGIALLPTELILLFSKLRLKPRAKKIIMPLLLTGCLLYMPITYYTLPFCITSSATTNHHNYRMFDAICPANRDGIFQDLFPAQPVFSDIEYHYIYSETVFGDSCDIYAQWTLKPSEFASEIDRVQGLFDRNSAENITLLTTQAGAYRCLIWYTGTAPFKTANEDYTYHIFAYNEQTLTVRYIYCWSELNGADQPYYLSLSW